MNKTSVLHAPSYAHQGEFIAAATINQYQVCKLGTDATAGSEGVMYLQNVNKLTPVASAGDAQDQTALLYMGYKWPTEDDYYLRNGLSNEYITTGEGIIGLQLMPGVKIQEYVGRDYTCSNGIKLGLIAPNFFQAYWNSATRGTLLYLTNSGQLTPTATNLVPRAQFVEMKGNWITVEFIGARHTWA